MNGLEHFLAGAVIGIFVGGVLSYEYASSVITKTIYEYNRIANVVQGVKKAL